MVMLCKQKALFVKACVIANGITDSQGDTLYAEDIKKIFTSFNNQDNFEIHHNDIPIKEVSLLENYINTADETIGNSIVPSGSWMAVIRVDNPDIQTGLLDGTFKGVSLNNRIADKCKANLHGTIRYKDIADAECVIPLLISFVDSGANGYGLHVMDYDAYIKKSNTRRQKNMAFDLLSGLKKLVQQAEADEEPVIKKEDPKKEEETTEETVETNTEDEVEVKKEDDETKPEEEEAEEEPVIEKEETTDEDFEAKVTAIVKKVISELQTEEGEETEEVEETTEEDAPKITKSSKVIIDTPVTAPEQTSYFEMSGRDPITGCKIRK